MQSIHAHGHALNHAEDWQSSQEFFVLDRLAPPAHVSHMPDRFRERIW